MQPGQVREFLVRWKGFTAAEDTWEPEENVRDAMKKVSEFRARKADAGERVDLAAGMAKLFASETASELALDAMRIHGGNGYSTEYPVERYYRDAPLMIIGEGTSEIQKLVISRALLAED